MPTFFQDAPSESLKGILPLEGEDSLWDALKVLPHLNRRRRKALHEAKSWVIHLFAGPCAHKEFAKLEGDGTVVLELDVRRAPSQNLFNAPLWSLLMRVAREGRISGLVGGPPCRTMSVLRHRPGGPPPVRSPSEPFGLSTLTAEERELVDHDMGFFQEFVQSLPEHLRTRLGARSIRLLFGSA